MSKLGERPFERRETQKPSHLPVLSDTLPQSVPPPIEEVEDDYTGIPTEDAVIHPEDSGPRPLSEVQSAITHEHDPGAHPIRGPDASAYGPTVDTTAIRSQDPPVVDEAPGSSIVYEAEAQVVDEDAERARLQQQILSEAPRANVIDVRRRRLMWLGAVLLCVIALVLGLVFGLRGNRSAAADAATATALLNRDECVGAISVETFPFTYSSSTDSATFVGSESLVCSVMDSQDHGNWFLVKGSGSCFNATATGSGFDAVLGVYQGDCNDLSCLDSDDSIPLSTVFWKSALRSYYVLVAGDLGLTGNYELAIAEYDCIKHDDCDGANLVEALPFKDSGNTMLATPETSDALECSTINEETRGVFYEIDGTGSCLTASTAGSDFETALAVYEGSCGQLSCKAYEVDRGYPKNSKSSITWNSQQGSRYKLLVAGYEGAVGNFSLTIAENECDRCAGAIDVGDLPFSDSGNTGFSSVVEDTIFQPTCPSIETGDKGVWYTLEAGAHCITASTERSDLGFDTVLTIFEGRDCENLSCAGQNDNVLQCHESCSGSSITWNPPSEGTIYKVLLSGKDQQTGKFVLDIVEEECDRCHNPILVNALPYSDVGSNEFAREVEDVGLECFVVRSEDRGVWYKLENLGTGSCITASTKGSEFDTVLAAYEVEDYYRGCKTLKCKNTNGNLPPAPDRNENETMMSEVFWKSELGTRIPKDYYLFVGGQNGVTGTYNLSIKEYECLENDHCTSAALVESLPYTYTGTTINATPDHSSGVLDCSYVDKGTRGVWHEVMGTGSCMSASLETDFNDLLAVFEGNCSQLMCVVQDMNRIVVVKSKVTWISQRDTVYHIYVAGFEDIVGDYNLTIKECMDKDECLVAEEVSDLPFVDSDNLNRSEYASPDFRLASPCTDFNSMGTLGLGFWYNVIGTGSCITVSTQGSEIDTVVGVYLGDCSDDLQCVAFNDETVPVPNDHSSEVTWRSTAAALYRVLVAGFANEVGPFDLEIKEQPCLQNDECFGATNVEALPYSDTGSTVGAAVVDGAASVCLLVPEDYYDHIGENGPRVHEPRGVWYTLDGGLGSCFNATAFAYYEDEPFRVWLAVYEGDCTSLSCLDVGESSVSWDSAGAETAYGVLVMGHLGYVGSFNLTITGC